MKDPEDAVSQLAEALVRLGSRGEVDGEALRSAIANEMQLIEQREVLYGGTAGKTCTVERIFAQRCIGEGGGGGGQVMYARAAGPPGPIVGGGGSACTPCIYGWQVCIDYACRLDVQG